MKNCDSKPREGLVLKIRYEHWIPRMLKVEGIVLYPYMLFAAKSEAVSARTRRHEMEHVDQVMRVGRLRFYLSYVAFYIAWRAAGKNHFDAYWAIPWEVEARAAEEDSSHDHIETYT